jgi:hypothetical protein
MLNKIIGVLIAVAIIALIIIPRGENEIRRD